MSTTAVEQDVIDKAYQTLDGIETIAQAEMLVHGEYMTDSRVDPTREKAVCKGHKACLIGSAYLGYKVRRKRDIWGDGWELPGTASSERSAFVKQRPGLALALELLDAAALRRINRRGLIVSADMGDPDEIPGLAAEAFFEGWLLRDPSFRGRVRRARYGKRAANRHDVIDLVRSARRSLEKVQVAT